MNMKRGLRNTSVIGAMALALVACGGGGGGSAASSSAPTGATLLLDTSGGVNAPVQVRLIGVFVEDLAGARSADLLEAPIEVLLADPGGMTESIPLRALPDGVWDRFVFAYDRAQRLGDPLGPMAVQPEMGAIAVPFDMPHPVSGADGQRLRVRHVAALGSGGGTLGSDLRAGAVTGAAFESLHATIRPDGRAVFGGSLEAALSFETGASLSAPNGSHSSSSSWLAGFGRGESCDLDGTFVSNDRFLVRSGSRRGRGGCERKAYGRLTSVDPVGLTVVVEVAFERDASGRIVASTGRRSFDASGARIVDDSPRGGLPLQFSDLRTGQYLEVEFCSGPVARAYEIEIEDGPGFGAGPEIEGRVVGVDLMTREIHIGRRGDDPLLIGGQSVNAGVVELPNGLDVLRVYRGGRDPELVPLSGVRSTDRIWARGRVTGPARVVANWVRVRDDS